jgi:hypothetical protein
MAMGARSLGALCVFVPSAPRPRLARPAARRAPPRPRAAAPRAALEPDSSRGGGGLTEVALRAASVALLGGGLAQVAAPARALHAVWATVPLGALLPAQIRTLGGLWVLAGVAAHVLADAAARGRFESPTQRRLATGLTAFGAATLFALTAPGAAAAASPAMQTGATVAAGAIAASGAAALQAGAGRPLAEAPVALVAGAREWLFGLFDLPSTLVAAYALASAAFAVAGAALALGRSAPALVGAPAGALSATLARLVGAGALLAAAATHALADAARRDKLHASAFRALNLGLGAAMLVAAYAAAAPAGATGSWAATADALAFCALGATATYQAFTAGQ